MQSGKDWGDYGNGGEGLGFLSSDFEEEEEEGKEWGGAQRMRERFRCVNC